MMFVLVFDVLRTMHLTRNRCIFVLAMFARNLRGFPNSI